MAPPTATQPARPNQRDHILDVALRLMSEHGASKTSMRQLATACNLNVAAIYYYFESKDALLAAVVDERRYGARLAVIPEMDPDSSPEQRLTTIFNTVWDGAFAEEPIWRLVLGEGLRQTPEVLEVGKNLLHLFRPGLTDWLRVSLPEVTEPAAAADLMIGQLFTGFMRHIFEPGLPLNEIASDAVSSLKRVLL